APPLAYRVLSGLWAGWRGSGGSAALRRIPELEEFGFRTQDNGVIGARKGGPVALETLVKTVELGVLAISLCIDAGSLGIALALDLLRLGISLGQELLAFAIGLGPDALAVGGAGSTQTVGLLLTLG